MAEQEVHELVIIKHRGGHDEDAHHGGVWKIAYADFMTAMMAFFLVMWLLNSTNKDAKISIRNYFNPIKLAEASMTRKGIIDEKDASPATAPNPGKKMSSEEGGQKKGEGGLLGPSAQPDEKSAVTPSEAKQPEGPRPLEGSKLQEGAKPQEGGSKPLDGTKGGAPASKSPGPGKPGMTPTVPASGSYTEAQLFKDPFRALS